VRRAYAARAVMLEQPGATSWPWFCLMVGTAALPHILMRYYTTPSVREARESVFWSLFFIFLLYFTAPAYAVFAKYEVYTNVIGTADSPPCPAGWRPGPRSGLVAVEDINRDGILQLAELTLNPT
jgi:cation/acetate symporter